MSPRSARVRVMVTGAGAPIGEMVVRSLLDDSRIGHILAVTGHPVEAFLCRTRSG